jgi:MFS family permease
MGRVTDKFGRKNALLATMLLFSIVFFVYSYATLFVQMYAAQALEGAAWAGETAAATALIGDFTAHSTRGTGLGLYGTSGYLGWIVGPIFGGALAEAAGFRSTFLICALLNVAGLVLTAAFLRQNSKASSLDRETDEDKLRTS